MWLDVEKGVKFGSYASEDKKLATHGISSINNLCDDRQGCGSNVKEEEGDECDLETVICFSEACATYKTANHSSTCKTLVCMTNRTF